MGDFISFVNVTMSDNDKKLLIVLLVFVLLFFIVFGLIGMGIRWLTKYFSSRVDVEMADCVKFGIVTDAKHFRELGKKKNNRIFFIQSSPAMIIALVSVVILIIYCGITGRWTENFWGEWGDLIYYPLLQDADFVIFWGAKVLARWPVEWHVPTWNVEHMMSYLLVTLWLVSIVYLIVCTHAYIARLVMIRRRARTIYDKNMEDYNYYDHVNKVVDPMSASAQINRQNQQQNPVSPTQNPYQNPSNPSDWNR